MLVICPFPGISALLNSLSLFGEGVQGGERKKIDRSEE